MGTLNFVFSGTHNLRPKVEPDVAHKGLNFALSGGKKNLYPLLVFGSPYRTNETRRLIRSSIASFINSCIITL